MRVKRKKHGKERYENCGSVVISDASALEDVCAVFGNTNPLRIEIGCGKGDFITGTAAKEPDVNFIAFEKILDVIVVAAEKAVEKELTNVKLCCLDAKSLPEVLAPGSVERIYLNFSDPWPKAGHYKRRLTYRGFLCEYKKLLVPEGAVFFKTDNDALFDFSLAEFEAAGLTLKNVTRDLHASEFASENVMTEYEKRFSEAGKTINWAEAWL